ncbi:hypothetical protein LMG1873_05451 [Achromobacter piechaudii]|uniref:Uncharacterized protein n=2 Tax=Achromobacter piechaudii TaxID=72556 RepID=A0ABM8L525_9BURK|nr:hypothetical protein LMG1873_05451 [Achromobacter piechaudii]CAB3921262.1 hypothetical protein LMG2828_05597 [Achromobacter piechaudii]CAB3958439.1 hypothetical protein LMG6103_05418 [Achromobacter piechaudii]
MSSERRVLSQQEIEDEWPSFVQVAARVSMDIDDVPQGLRVLVPYAVFWGVTDDWIREDVFSKTPQSVKENLKWVISEFDDELDSWLAGPEAEELDPSDAYLAFSAMRMGVDSI